MYKSMSTIHNIKPKQTFAFSELNKKISEFPFHVKYDKRGDFTFYYWVPEKSTRGVDVSIEGDIIEIRNTVLSNVDDYELTNYLTREIISLTHGRVYNEDEEEVVSDPVFSSDKIKQLELDECNLLTYYAEKDQEFTVFGPVREVHIGKRIINELRQEGESGIVNLQLLDLILEVNYNLPDYEEGIVMEGKDPKSGKWKYMKVITNTVDLIIGKYDAVLFTDGEKVFMISNELLNTILPGEWELVDEYTIIAPILEERSWLKLLEAARALDISSEIL